MDIMVGGGGGSSDIRIMEDSLYARIIVAGGGGGAGLANCGHNGKGGFGGGNEGENGDGDSLTTGGNLDNGGNRKHIRNLWSRRHIYRYRWRSEEVVGMVVVQVVMGEVLVVLGMYTHLVVHQIIQVDVY